MSTENTDVLIKIITAYSEGGLEAAKKAADELKKTVGEASDAGGALNGILGMMEKDGYAAGKVLGGLSDILKNGTGSAAGFVKIIQGIGPALGLATNGIGMLIGAVSLGIQAWNQHKQAAKEAAEAAQKAAEEEQKAAEEAAKAAEDAAKAIEQASEDAADKVKEQITGVADGFQDAVEQAHALDDALSALEDAQLELDLAELDQKLESATTPEEKAAIKKQKAQLKVDAATAKRRREEQKLQDEIAAMDQSEAAAQSKVQETENNYWQGVATAKHKKQMAAEADQKAKEAEEDLGRRPQFAHAAIYKGQKKALEDWDAKNAEVEKLKQKAEDAHKEAEEYADSLEVMTAEMDAAKETLAGVKGKNAIARKKNQIKIETLGVKQQKSDLDFSAKGREIDKEEKDAKDAAAEEEAKQLAALKSKPAYIAAEVGAMVGKGQRDSQGQLYDADVDGGVTRRQALGTLWEAVNNAAASKGGDAEEAAIIAQAVEAIGSMGANLLADKAQINAKLQELVNAIQKVESQIKNSRR